MSAPYPGDLLVHLASFVRLLENLRGGPPAAFERTARDLGLDRSVLRRRIGTLSSWIGAPLLRGRGAGLVSTEAGARLEERAKTLLVLVGDLAADVQTARERVVLACTGTITTQLVPSVLVELERDRPIRLGVRRAGGSSCEHLVRNGEVDLGVVRASSPPRGLMSKHLTDDRLWLVIPSESKRRPSRVSLEEMAGHPLVLYGASSRTRTRIMERLEPLGATVRVEVDGRASALAYVRAGFGATFLSLLPGHHVDEPGVVAIDVTSLFARSGFYVIGRRGTWNDPAIRAVLDRLVAHAQRRHERARKPRARA